MGVLTRFSLEQYELMARAGVFDGKHRQRVEFIRGEIQKMTPIGPRHAWAVERLSAWSFDNAPRNKVVLRIQSPLRIPELESAAEPDLLWAANKDYSSQHPQPEDVLLLIEVAETSLEYDTGEKARLYAEAGIADYWVAGVLDNCVEVFRQPSASGYQSRQIHRADEQIRPLAFPQVAIRPALLFRPS